MDDMHTIHSMDEKKPTTDITSTDELTDKQSFTTLKDATDPSRIVVPRVQNVILIWLNTNINEDSDECRSAITELRRVVNVVSTFTDSDECIQFIKSNSCEKVCMVIPGYLGQLIVPVIHSIPQLSSIFIFCGNRRRHEQWTTEWPKIKGVFTEMTLICEALKEATTQHERDATSISFMSTNSEASSTNLDHLNCSFMYTQILKEILLSIEFKQEHIQEYIDYCRDVFAENDAELKNVCQFESKYPTETPIWWYTFDCFLYPMLNRALRTMEVNVIIKIGFFINDLHRHIEKLHTEQFTTHPQSQILILYRGQGLSKIDFDHLVESKGGLMAFNSFLSTSNNRKTSLSFAQMAVANLDMVGILFVMKIDPSLPSTPFASIADVSYFKAENEVLFSMHSVFRIGEIKAIGKNDRLWEVALTLTNDNDRNLRDLTARIREEIEGLGAWDRLGRLLLRMGEAVKAEQVYEVLLKQTSDDLDKATIYHRLGTGKYDRGQYAEAMAYYEQSLQIRQKTLPSTHPDLVLSYNNIGLVHSSRGEYLEALSKQKQALEIRQKTLSPTHSDLASSYNNIGLVYYKMGENMKGLSYYEKALIISQTNLPPTHPDLAKSYNNIALVYCKMNEYVKALSYYEKALEINETILPPMHPDLATSYNSIGVVYYEIGETAKALSYYEKALEIRQRNLPSTHPSLIKSYNNIGTLYYSLSEYAKALSFYEKALEIKQTTLPSMHLDLASSYSNIGLVYYKRDEYSTARSFFRRAVDIGERALSTDHPLLQRWLQNLDLVEKKF